MTGVHRAHTWHRPHGNPCIRRRRCGNTASPGRAAGGGPWVALDHRVWPRAAAHDLRSDTSRQRGLCTVHRHGTDSTALLVADVGGRDTRRPHVIFWMSMRQARFGLLLGLIGVAHTLQSSNSSLWFDIRAAGAVPVSGVANPWCQVGASTASPTWYLGDVGTATCLQRFVRVYGTVWVCGRTFSYMIRVMPCAGAARRPRVPSGMRWGVFRHGCGCGVTQTRSSDPLDSQALNLRGCCDMRARPLMCFDP